MLESKHQKIPNKTRLRDHLIEYNNFGVYADLLAIG